MENMERVDDLRGTLLKSIWQEGHYVLNTGEESLTLNLMSWAGAATTDIDTLDEKVVTVSGTREGDTINVIRILEVHAEVQPQESVEVDDLRGWLKRSTQEEGNYILYITYDDVKLNLMSWGGFMTADMDELVGKLVTVSGTREGDTIKVTRLLEVHDEVHAEVQPQESEVGDWGGTLRQSTQGEGDYILERLIGDLKLNLMSWGGAPASMDALVGKEVTVSGTRQGDTINVTRIEISS